MKSKLGAAIFVAAAALSIVLALAACGGGGGSSGEGSSGSDRSDNQDRQQAALDYARCMREHGVDFPDPVNGRFEFRSERGDQRRLEEAQRACQDILQDAMPQVDEEQEAEMREAALDFAKCMREHGIDMPDPTFPEGGGMLMRMPKGAEDDPDFDEAQKACQSILDAAQPEGPALQGEES